MGEWLTWDSALKALTIAGTGLGLVKSWRNQWKGPLDLYEHFVHPHAENVRLRYRLYRVEKDLRFKTTQLAERDKQLDEVVEWTTEQKKAASLLESSVASVAEEIRQNPPRLRVTPTLRPKSKRSRNTLPTRKK